MGTIFYNGIICIYSLSYQFHEDLKAHAILMLDRRMDLLMNGRAWAFKQQSAGHRSIRGQREKQTGVVKDIT